MLLLWGGGGVPGWGQQVLPGVVWQEPEGLGRAAKELVAMRTAGVKAIRTGVIRHPELLAMADTLGLQFFQDLPVFALPAAGLQDTLAYAQRWLAQTLAQARQHRSARHFGLAGQSDTSDPAACAYFGHLAEQARRQGPAGTQVYYLTPFVAADRCARQVDFVLLDLLNEAEPIAVVQEWSKRQGGGAPVGVGALGRWVDPSAGRGLRAVYSPEDQARYLETHLAMLLEGALPIRAVFVYRWRDAFPDTIAAEAEQDHLVGRFFGLYAADGAPRPACDVVAGFFTGQQRVFAYPLGEAHLPPWPWRTLLGWGILAMQAVFYATSPRFRFMIPRYFLAHGFFRDAIREGRDVLPIPTLALFMALALATGMLNQLVLSFVEPALLVAAQWLPRPLRLLLTTSLARPWLLILLLSSFYALGMALWASLISVLSYRYYRLNAAQVLMLIVWPRWSLFLLLIGVMAMDGVPQALQRPAMVGLIGFWLVFTLLAVGRTVYDWLRVAHPPWWGAVLALLGHPLVALGLGLLLLRFTLPPELTFFWHLLTRG